VKLSIGAPWILDFDIENRPLTYLGSDFTTAEVTAIAMAWDFPGDRYKGEDVFSVFSVLLGQDSPEDILQTFVAQYNAADIVTGHYIRKHDLPIINGALTELGMAPLAPKMTIDTKLDLIRFSGVSKSQESLAGMFGVAAPKVHMTQADWREANRLTPEGLAKTRERVEGDVRQHMQLRAELTKRGMLRAPRVWRP
jgi:hypothetical protein